MNSRIREIVRKHYDCACSATRSVSEALIKELEAYHDKAMVEAADGALMGRAMLDRALGRDARPRKLGPNHKGGDACASSRLSGEGYNRVRVCSCGAEDHEPGFSLDTSLDVRPGSKSPGDAVSDYVAGMFDDLWARRDALTRACEPTKRTMLKLDEIIERNARGWQEGETDDERARR